MGYWDEIDKYQTGSSVYGNGGGSGVKQNVAPYAQKDPNADSKMNWGGLIGGATSLMELYNLYKASKDPKLSFQQPPLSPEQRKMWELAYGAASTLPTAQMLGPMAQSILGGYSGMGWKGQGNVAIPYYGMEASGPSYSSPNTQYKLGPQYWPTQGQGGANVAPPGVGPSGKPTGSAGRVNGVPGQPTPELQDWQEWRNEEKKGGRPGFDLDTHTTKEPSDAYMEGYRPSPGHQYDAEGWSPTDGMMQRPATFQTAEEARAWLSSLPQGRFGALIKAGLSFAGGDLIGAARYVAQVVMNRQKGKGGAQ